MRDTECQYHHCCLLVQDGQGIAERTDDIDSISGSQTLTGQSLPSFQADSR
ncbi:hypothetical protein J5X98_13295 [Leptothermofonsia sichuanensis E412]|uniref:hypothetical protein n=1 Tax=Leptothermofonsia sichuanensis TaxID=2917832 RepID=UPI001CA60C62|nr:hypothetical protein [Leptothermofonsia sichuanensis]QZZ23221.1 hypothetical protein J5X98_13295 [Leptothermofonsia sichuanensis E412]